MDYPEPISSGLASFLVGLCYGFIAGVLFAILINWVL